MSVTIPRSLGSAFVGGGVRICGTEKGVGMKEEVKQEDEYLFDSLENCRHCNGGVCIIVYFEGNRQLARGSEPTVNSDAVVANCNSNSELVGFLIYFE